MKWKRCNTCDIIYHFTSNYFHKAVGNKSGLRNDCKWCNRQRVKNRYKPKRRTIPRGFRMLPYSANYYVSKDGRVWSWKLNRLMRPHKHGKDKYLQLTINGKCKKVHQLVLETFVRPCPEGKECRHLDGNPENNNLENLHWGTKSENTKDAVKHGTHPVAKLNATDVREIKRLLKTPLNQVIVAKIFEVSPSLISKINTGKVWNYVQVDK